MTIVAEGLCPATPNQKMRRAHKIRVIINAPASIREIQRIRVIREIRWQHYSQLVLQYV